MSSKELVSDAEYAKEVRQQYDYLNWIFGLSTFFVAIACLQFKSPQHVALVALGIVSPMYVYAFFSRPPSYKVLRELLAETRSDEVHRILRKFESKYYGWKVIPKAFLLWFALAFYMSVLLGWVGMIRFIQT